MEAEEEEAAAVEASDRSWRREWGWGEVRAAKGKLRAPEGRWLSFELNARGPLDETSRVQDFLGIKTEAERFR